MAYEIINFLTSPIFFIIVGSYFASFWLAIVVWTWVDTSKRTKNLLIRLSASLLVTMSGVFGLVIYFILRPRQTLAERRSQELEERVLEKESKFSFCPTCKGTLEPDFTLCPACRTRVKNICPVCQELLDISWLFCPYCGHEEILLPKRGRGRPRKYPLLIGSLEQPRRPRGRPRKYPIDAFKVKRPRGRPRKIETPTATA